MDRDTNEDHDCYRATLYGKGNMEGDYDTVTNKGEENTKPESPERLGRREETALFEQVARHNMKQALRASESQEDLNGPEQWQHSETPRKLRRLNHKLDPFSAPAKLPTELVQIILGHVETADLLCAALVSHNWHKVVASHSELYSRLKFWGTVSVADISSFLRTCNKYNITHISLMRIHYVEEGEEGDVIKEIGQSRLQIGSLEVYCGSLDVVPKNIFCQLHTLTLGFDPLESLSLGHLIEALPALRNVSLQMHPSMRPDTGLTTYPSFPQLDSFTLELCDDNTTYNPADLIAHCGFQKCTKLALDSTALDAVSLERMLREMEPEKVCITNTEVGYNALKRAMSLSGIQPTFLEVEMLYRDEEVFEGGWKDALKELTTLKLGSMDNLEWEVFGEILDATRENVREFEMANSCDAFFGDSKFQFYDVFDKCPDLQSFRIRHCDTFSDASCRELGEALKMTHSRLETLTVPCSRLSDWGIRMLLEGHMMPSLELRLEYDIFKEETVRFLRAHCGRVVYGNKWHGDGYLSKAM